MSWDSWSPISPTLWSVWFLSSKAALKHKREARERDGGGGEGKVSTRWTSATARYTGTKYRYNNAVQVLVPVRLSVPVHTSKIKVLVVTGIYLQNDRCTSSEQILLYSKITSLSQFVMDARFSDHRVWLFNVNRHFFFSALLLIRPRKW